MKSFYTSLAVAIPLCWCGMIAGISFLEAPLKFTAPGITLALGLSIGSVVFHAFNAVELCLLCIWFLATRSAKLKGPWLPVIAVLFIVGIQSFWLLPALENRASVIIQGGLNPPASVHVYYVVCEVTKFLILAFTGFSLIHKIQRSGVPVTH